MNNLDLETLKTFSVENLQQPWEDRPDVSGKEVSQTAGLQTDLTYSRTPTQRTFADYRTKPEAFKHLARLPEPGETHHGVISGKYALFDLIGATIERINVATIETLYLATLSFSNQNAADLLALIDAKKVNRVTLLISHYFKSTSRHIYDTLVPQLIERGHKVLAMRTHCKIILVQTSEGRKYTVESSANLRSCKNIEQFTYSQDNGLYDFHANWIEGLFNETENKPE